jgi:hypothetical protein
VTRAVSQWQGARALARVTVGNALVEVGGGFKVGASGEVLVDHGLSGTERLVLDGFDIAFVGIHPYNVVLSLLLQNQSGANAKTADAENRYIVFWEGHREGVGFSATRALILRCLKKRMCTGGKALPHLRFTRCSARARSSRSIPR